MNKENSLQETYDNSADAYSQFLETPLGTLEQELFDLCITDCTDFHVLDLGGGTGLRAHDALEAGARAVDVVDISAEMMRQGQQAFSTSIHREKITWHQGDASQSLSHLDLGSYDMVIANGIFDHACTDEELEAMWSNAAAHLKPGGRVVANRNVPYSRAAADGKYGVTFTDFQKLPGDGGISYQYRMATDLPLVFRSMGLETYYSGSVEIPERFFEDFQNVPWEETPIVKADPEFWRLYLQDPILYIFTARKRS